MSAIFENPTNYGRIVRNADGALHSIVEEKDATIEQKKIQEMEKAIKRLKEWGKLSNYDIVANTEKIGIENVAKMIANCIKGING